MDSILIVYFFQFNCLRYSDPKNVDFLVNPMSLLRLKEKIGTYQSFEEFLSDAKWIEHNCLILYNNNSLVRFLIVLSHVNFNLFGIFTSKSQFNLSFFCFQLFLIQFVFFLLFCNSICFSLHVFRKSRQIHEGIDVDRLFR